ncbi:hypothetical protein RFI_24173 [Reticulomyxa filosa]|uniref:Helicase ATP-binding domain-containing protein n=1 Tax=Reticulomyxa filosa TaxID=46433 RepID=X6MHQ2_RETFI|nr:hypothetical protein RFI_24173 [Reticulomyxa filosa]|eukprot:ETO13201.1 hypothetical protein RFI_24173 [Reticulomyxa filosa]
MSSTSRCLTNNDLTETKKCLNVIGGPASHHPFWAGYNSNSNNNHGSFLFPSSSSSSSSFNIPGTLPSHQSGNDSSSSVMGINESGSGNSRVLLQPRLTQETLDSIFPGTFVKNLPSTIDGIKLQYMTETQVHVSQDLVENNHNPLSNTCHVIASAAGTGKTTMALILALFELYTHEKRMKNLESRFHRNSNKDEKHSSNHENQKHQDSDKKNTALNHDYSDLAKNSAASRVYIFIVVPQSCRIDGIVNWLERAHYVCNFRVLSANRHRTFPELARLQKGQYLCVGTPESFGPKHVHGKSLERTKKNSHQWNSSFNTKVLLFSNTWNDLLERDLRKMIGEEGKTDPSIKNYCRQQFMHWYMECDKQPGKFSLLHQLCEANPYEKALIFVNFFWKVSHLIYYVYIMFMLYAFNFTKTSYPFQAQSLRSVLNQQDVILYDYSYQQDVDKLMLQLRSKRVKGLLCADGQRGLHDIWKIECNVVINYDLCNSNMYMKRAASCGVENEVVHIVTFLAKEDKEYCEYRSMLKHLKVEGQLLSFDKKTVSQGTQVSQ